MNMYTKQTQAHRHRKHAKRLLKGEKEDGKDKLEVWV